MADSFGEYLANLKCKECGAHADHRQAGRLVCRTHLDPSVPAFATND